MDVVEVLEKAKERLKGHWCQGAYFRATDGYSINSPTEGCQVCSLGAVAAVTPGYSRFYSPERRTVYRFLDMASRELSGEISITADLYNDCPDRTEEEVLALFDKAIELAKAEEVNAK